VVSRRERSVEGAWFERLYAEQGDPWGFETSAYEQAKYAETIRALPRPRYADALEVGCANGVLTALLAPHCDRLLGVDPSPTALAAARARCRDLPQVRLEERSLPAQAPAGSFDLILLSEVIYYWDSADLARIAAYLIQALRSGGDLLLVHWTGDTDYPQSGDDAVTALRALLGGAVVERRHNRHDQYRLDLWRRA
jgi:SAM-dependent methyltransferase